MNRRQYMVPRWMNCPESVQKPVKLACMHTWTVPKRNLGMALELAAVAVAVVSSPYSGLPHAPSAPLLQLVVCSIDVLGIIMASLGCKPVQASFSLVTGSPVASVDFAECGGWANRTTSPVTFTSLTQAMTKS